VFSSTKANIGDEQKKEVWIHRFRADHVHYVPQTWQFPIQDLEGTALEDACCAE
jgi:hypothetical protein